MLTPPVELIGGTVFKPYICFLFSCGNPGIGTVTAVSLAMRAARVISVCRDRYQTRESLRTFSRGKRLNILIIDAGERGLKSNILSFNQQLLKPIPYLSSFCPFLRRSRCPRQDKRWLLCVLGSTLSATSS